MALSLGSRRVILIAVLLATMFATWRFLESRQPVRISVDSYDIEDAGLVVSTTAFNRLNHRIKLRAVIEVFRVSESQFGMKVASILKR